MDREHFVSCVRVIYTLLHADDDYSAQERDFISHTMDEMRFNEEERALAQTTMSLEACEAAIADLPPLVVGSLIQSLVQGALVDGVDDRERTFINKLAKDIGVDDYTLGVLWERAGEEDDD